MAVDFDRDDMDGILFRLWIRLASSHPGAVAKALGPCLSPAAYREALVKLAGDFKINLPE